MTHVLAKTKGLARTEGVVWLRKTIFIDRNFPKEDVGLILGRIGNADETYFNGTRIGATGEFPPGRPFHVEPSPLLHGQPATSCATARTMS